MHSDCLQELTLCSPSFIAVFLSVEIERRLDSRVTQDSLHCLRFDLRLVHQVDAAHDATHLRNRRPGKTARLVERFEPPLNIEQLDVFRDFDSETRGEIGAHDMLQDRKSTRLNSS